MATTDKTVITTDSGCRAEALAPVVISASRSTDIPAFYAKWFFNRLQRGYCVWTNPFNRKPTYVSFEHCRAIVFWTKNPKPILPYLHILDERRIHYYFQVTLNDYVNEGFEPNVPSVEERAETFRRLAEMIGKERVVWRFDPLIVTPTLTPAMLLSKIERVGNMLRGLTEKLVFSFVDVRAYKKVQRNMAEIDGFDENNVTNAEMNYEQRQQVVEGIAALISKWRSEGWNITAATCGEEFDYRAYGIEKNRCIDGELMERVFKDDKPFIYYLRTGKRMAPNEQTLFGPEKTMDILKWKDKGQRMACGCMISKDIGMYNTCRHFCVYCYANASCNAVEKNNQRHSDESESLID